MYIHLWIYLQNSNVTEIYFMDFLLKPNSEMRTEYISKLNKVLNSYLRMSSHVNYQSIAKIFFKHICVKSFCQTEYYTIFVIRGKTANF